MLKYILWVILLILLCFSKQSWYMIQNLLFVITFMFMLSVDFWIWSNLKYFFGYDYMSFGLSLLSFWICILMILASYSIIHLKFFSNLLLLMVLLLLFMLVCSFCSMSLISFSFFFFEGSLIPTLFLIFGLGYQPERMQAGVYLLFYILFASLPLLLGVVYLYDELNSLNFF